MFDKNKFAQIIKDIKETYSSQEEFSKKSGIGRTYLSQYANMKLDEAPKPKTLEKLANASHGITTYEELMLICGYLTLDSVKNENLLAEYNKLTALEKEHEKNNKLRILKETLTFSQEEYHILWDMKEKILSNIFNNIPITEEDIYNSLDIYDFLSDNSKKKIVKSLLNFYNYNYEKEKIENNIQNQKKQDDSYNIDSFSYQNPYYFVPVYGQISAGQPNWAEECIEGRIPIDPNLMNILNPEEHFFLRVNGESMNKVIKNGAFALIHKQDIVKNGEIAVVLVNGYDATLKKFTKQDNLIILEPQSNDESFKTQVYDKNTTIKILGKYVGKMELN